MQRYVPSKGLNASLIRVIWTKDKVRLYKLSSNYRLDGKSEVSDKGFLEVSQAVPRDASTPVDKSKGQTKFTFGTQSNS